MCRRLDNGRKVRSKTINIGYAQWIQSFGQPAAPLKNLPPAHLTLTLWGHSQYLDLVKVSLWIRHYQPNRNAKISGGDSAGPNTRGKHQQPGRSKADLCPPTANAFRRRPPLKLEDLQPDTTVRGILPDAAVTVVTVQWNGSYALTLVYLGTNRTLFSEL